MKNFQKNLVKKDNVLARGETTGHSHRIEGNASVMMDVNGNQFVEVFEDSRLLHEEHHEQEIEKGKYEVIIQREVDLVDETVKQVTD